MRFPLLLPICLFALSAHAEKGQPAAAKPKEYQLSAKLEPASLTPGASAKYVLTIAPKEGYLFKSETPFKATLSSSGSAKVAKSEFSSKDFEDPKAAAKSISTTVTAGDSCSDEQITADLSFFLCTDQICQRFTDKLALPLSAK